MKREQFGNAAHSIGGESCRFHLATRVGSFVVSTVGDYFPKYAGVSEGPQEIGLDRKFETMVFRVDGVCECGCGMPTHNGESIDFDGYSNRATANAGHEAMCQKYERDMTAAQTAGE